MIDSYDRKYLSIAFPAAFEGLFMILLASADLIMVGTLGAVSIAAVSIFIQPRLIVLCFSRSLASAVTLLVSREAGRGDKKTAAGLLKKSLFIGSAVFLPIHGIFYFYLEDIFFLMGAEPEYMTEALAYGEIAVISVFITSVTTLFQAVQLGFGHTAAIMKSNIFGNIVNVIMNFLLIFGMGPFPALGVTGAAIGTVLGTLCSFYRTVVVMKRDKFLGGGSFLPDKAYFKRMTPLFLSVFSEQVCERTGMALFTGMIAGLGTIPFVVHNICMNISDIYWDYITGFGKASMVTAGQSVGKNSEKEWNAYRKKGIKWGLIFSTIACGAIIIFREEMFSFYSNDPAALAMSGTVMIICAFAKYPAGHCLICTGILRGSGRAAVVAVYAFVSIAVFRPLMTAFFLYIMGWGLAGAWTALLLDQSVRAVCGIVFIEKIKCAGWDKLIADLT